MPAERRKRLDKIEFVWDALDSTWEEGFAALRKFKAREGHCRVPALHIDGKFKLGSWVLWQRDTKDTMPAERKKRLDRIGFVWGPYEAAWGERFVELKKFKNREGHRRVPPANLLRSNLYCTDGWQPFKCDWATRTYNNNIRSL